MDDSDELNEPYYPARYRELIRKKKQRRLIRKIGMAAVAVVAVVVMFFLLSGFLSGLSSHVPATPAPTAAPAVSPPMTTPVATAIATIPPAAITVPSTVRTTLAASKTVTATAAPTSIPEPILTASAGNYMAPKADSSPKITEQQAKIIASTIFPDLPAGDATVHVASNTDFGLVWVYTLRAGSVTEAGGIIDAMSGEVLTFNRTIHPGGRPTNPVLTLQDARAIADKTISDKSNVILSINMTSSRYVAISTQSGTIAGYYRFIFTRTIDNYPCDADGFIVSVDAVNGAVTEYVERWQTPDNAFAMVGDALIPRYDATYAIQTRAKSVYPSSVTSVRILSSDLLWKDRHDPATTPRPATIPLAWKVVFDDDVIRANPKLSPGVGWVDSQSGEIIGFDYQH